MSTYWDDVARVAEAHLDEIQADLLLARQELATATTAHREAEARVIALERLEHLALQGSGTAPAAAQMTLHLAMETVLREMGAMRAGDLAAQINSQRLYRMRDGRPVEAQQIHARVNNYSDRFVKQGTFIDLAGA